MFSDGIFGTDRQSRWHSAFRGERNPNHIFHQYIAQDAVSIFPVVPSSAFSLLDSSLFQAGGFYAGLFEM
jgi:hypothetical protein